MNLFFYSLCLRASETHLFRRLKLRPSAGNSLNQLSQTCLHDGRGYRNSLVGCYNEFTKDVVQNALNMFRDLSQR
jgi:hypothetical protein